MQIRVAQILSWNRDGSPPLSSVLVITQIKANRSNVRAKVQIVMMYSCLAKRRSIA
jgi:hypothetical protein